MDRKATVKSLDYPDLKIHVVGDVAIVRHLWVSDTELDGKTTNTKIGVMQVCTQARRRLEAAGPFVVQAAGKGVAPGSAAGRAAGQRYHWGAL